MACESFGERGYAEPMATATPQRPGLRAHAQATRLETAVLVKELRDTLGATLVAYLGGGARDPRRAPVGGGHPGYPRPRR